MVHSQLKPRQPPQHLLHIHWKQLHLCVLHLSDLVRRKARAVPATWREFFLIERLLRIQPYPGSKAGASPILQGHIVDTALLWYPNGLTCWTVLQTKITSCGSFETPLDADLPWHFPHRCRGRWLRPPGWWGGEGRTRESPLQERKWKIWQTLAVRRAYIGSCFCFVFNILVQWRKEESFFPSWLCRRKLRHSLYASRCTSYSQTATCCQKVKHQSVDAHFFRILLSRTREIFKTLFQNFSNPERQSCWCRCLVQWVNRFPPRTADKKC